VEAKPRLTESMVNDFVRNMEMTAKSDKATETNELYAPRPASVARILARRAHRRLARYLLCVCVCVCVCVSFVFTAIYFPRYVKKTVGSLNGSVE
jgi:hypothetical protein